MSEIRNILRGAWNTTRLDVIRAAVERTIGSLEALNADQMLRWEPSRSALDLETGSVRAALDSCCNELRDGCGLPMSPGRPMQIRSLRAADADWTQSFLNALEAYRRAARDELNASLAVPSSS